MTDQFEELLQRKKELTELTKKVDIYSIELLTRKRQLVDEVESIMKEEIKPRKDEMSELDSDIEKILKDTGQDKIVSSNYGAYMSDELSIKVTDIEKCLYWVSKNPQLLKKDILKASEINKLLKDGIVPDPITDGVDCNDSYQKITFRKK